MLQLPSHIYGMHDPGSEQLLFDAKKTGWVVISVTVNSPYSESNFTELTKAGIGVIVRLNNGYGSEGTISKAEQYDQFAQQCASFVLKSRGAKIWIIGNETNLASERPGNTGVNDGEVITPEKYAQCFSKCCITIKKLIGHGDDWIIPAAPSPWNTQTTYPGNTEGDWIKYFQDILTQCIQLGVKPDALALHTYTHGFDASLITSEDKMPAVFTNYHYHFRAYRDFLSVVPTALTSLPVLITEAQGADPDWWQDRNIGWIQAAFKEINDWNSVQRNQPIQALCLFRWQTGISEWSISDKKSLQDDYRAAMIKDYRVRWCQPPPDPTAAAAIAAANELDWMPINTSAALYKFAQANNLGYPQTDEFALTFDNKSYRVQVFHQGIVYAEEGVWTEIAWIKKPDGM